MRRPAVSLVVLCALAAAAPAGATDPAPPSGKISPTPSPALAPPIAPKKPSWAQAQIRAVVAHGLMGGSEATFKPDDPLTQGALADLVAGLTGEPALPVANPRATVSMAALDSKLVRALALSETAAQFASAARAAGLRPPSRFGTEVVARLLGLRTNHPAAQDDLELLPTDPATRAEAAYSAARILAFKGSEEADVQIAADSFVLPVLTVWQQRVLATAFGFVGFPYVWGGTSEKAEAPFGVKARGGFDCSGFVWRVYKLQPYPGAAALADTLRGRTTFAMSAEVPSAQRIPFARLEPGDVVFFGDKGPRSKPAGVEHMGIYVGSGWLVHSSGYGVALATMTGWYRDRFAWARRPLAEAGLVTTPIGG
jgi:cell wall-associated NlpC family hydrolase